MKYYCNEKDIVIKKFSSDEKCGLTSEQVNKNLNIYGKNVLPSKKKDSWIKIFFKGFLDPIVLLLLFTILFSLFIHEYVDAITIGFIILIDLVMGTIQEVRANETADSLAKLIKYNVKVIRNSEELEIDSSELVPGDIVLLESGNEISADMRLLETYNLQVDEAVLTGESVNIYKNSDVLGEDTVLSDRRNMVYAGTVVTKGRAKAIVVNTGINTEVGLIAKTVNNMKEEKSPLTIRMNKFSKQITMLIIVVAIILFIILYIKRVPFNEMVLSVIALSVSAMPEGLPLALTMALTITSNAMSKKNVITKKLNYVESLGSCTVIATDKTGTLTVNEQTAKLISIGDKDYEVSGIGYNFDGEIKNINDDIKKLCLHGLLNNEANIIKEKKEYNYYGDSIDIAFMVLANKAHVNGNEYKVFKRIPYESENKYSAVFYEYEDKTYCTVKGSFEKIIEFCNISKDEEKILKKKNDSLANMGYRVIALASGHVNKNLEINNLKFEGMVSFIDPIRKEVNEAIKKCSEAGIRVIMITGDHPLTAAHIAKDLGLINDNSEVATGVELNDNLGNINEFIKTKNVFARVTPMDKLNIVNALKENGEFVAVTGDGVNDAPAIKSANLGISMGSGTDVAKETASMIITDDNFASIVKGIELGRCAYSNIRKVCYFLLSCGLAEVLFFTLSIICDLPMPLIAIQLLWLNVVTDGLQDFALSFEKPEKKIMKEAPRNANESLFDKMLFREIMVSGLTIGLVVFFVWVYLVRIRNIDLTLARGYIMMLMVFIQNIHALNCRSETNSIFNVSFKDNPFIILVILGTILLQVVIMNIPFLRTFLEVDAVPFIHVISLFSFSLIILIVMEIYKLIKKRQ